MTWMFKKPELSKEDSRDYLLEIHFDSGRYRCFKTKDPSEFEDFVNWFGKVGASRLYTINFVGGSMVVQRDKITHYHLSFGSGFNQNAKINLY